MDNNNQKIYISSDHAGFKLKSFLMEKLTELGYMVNDLGPNSYDPTDDYPDYIKPTANGKQIVICKNGVGVSMLINKYKGVRCALSWNPTHAKSARNDDNINVLALPADYVDEDTALQTVLAFLETPFSQEAKHARRLEKFAQLGS